MPTDGHAMRNLSFRHIETLQAIAAAGSLVQAATMLNMTPAALTARVKGLEDAVALKLFDRTSTGMRLTKAGEAALDAARGVERAMRDFADAMLAISTGEGGRLSVGATSTAKYFAPRLIAAFVGSRPRLDLRFLIGNRETTIESLRSGEVEIALSGRPPRDLPVETFPVGPHPYVLIAAPEHRLAGAKELTRADLVGEAFLFRETGSGTRSLFDEFIGDTTIKRVQMGMELGSNETIKQAVMAGLGIALISAHTIAAEVASGRLVCLDVEDLPIVRRWYVLNRTDRALSPAARAFRDFAVSQGSTFLPLATGPGPALS
jgi:LysR family transcriptional regulator, low CO2-responsive transcriptional regulator